MTNKSNPNTAFCRSMLRYTMETVKRFTTAAQRKDAWVYKTGRQSWEFHGPDEFYWYGTADNAADARSQGWEAWLRRQGINEEE